MGRSGLLPGSIRRAIVAPLLLVTAVAFISLITMGSNIFVASQRESEALEHSAGMERSASKMAERLASSRAYVLEVMAMTRMIPTLEVMLEFGTGLYELRTDLSALRKQTGPEHLEHVRLLELALEDWIYEAELLLGLKSAPFIPTIEQLDRSAAEVARMAEIVVNHSREEAVVSIEMANRSVERSLRAGVLLTAGVVAVALAFAWRMASQISGAMQRVSRRLRVLADQENSGQSAQADEIRRMFASLETLENSIAEKARMSEQLKLEMFRAEEAARTKSQFLANMSHEIRTPINGVLGMAEILDSMTLDFEQKECVQTILKSSEALLAVINDILDFSKNEAGELQLDRQPFSLHDLLFDIAGLLGPAIGGGDVEIVIDYAEALPRWFDGDQGRVRQILMNIVGNAVKFTPGGYVVVTVSLNEDQPAPLSISVRDTGIGIAPDKTEEIFSAFRQAEMHASRRFHGTGLGLAIARQLARKMGGDISVRSEPGAGSDFTVKLAIDQAAPSEAPADQDNADISALNGKHVMIVDDLELNRAIQTKMLSAWGMTVHSFPGAGEVLNAEAGLLEKIDIGLLDFNMPKISGRELGQHLKEILGENCFPLILYSSSDQRAGFSDPGEQVFDAVLMKPSRSRVLARSFLGVLEPDRIVTGRRSGNDTDRFSGVDILVAEDNRTNRLVLEKILAPTGANLVFCENGEEAVRAYDGAGADLIFMDMSMPVMDGVTATREIRKLENSSGLAACPIVALTANAMASDRKACEAVGMSDFLTKPVRRAELIRCIESWAGGEAAAQGRKLV